MPRSVLISGGSRGLGAELVAGFLDAGCNVASFSRGSTEFVEGHLGSTAFHWRAIDGGDHAPVPPFVQEVAARFGGIDVLVNNTGIATDAVLPLMRADDIADMVETN